MQNQNNEIKKYFDEYKVRHPENIDGKNGKAHNYYLYFQPTLYQYPVIMAPRICGCDYYVVSHNTIPEVNQ